MSGALLKVPPGALEAAVVGLTRGAATHVDATVRRTCLQVRGGRDGGFSLIANGIPNGRQVWCCGSAT